MQGSYGLAEHPKASAMERVWEDRPVLDMTRHNQGEAAEIRRWADDLLSGVPMKQVLRDLAGRKVATVAMTDDARRTWEELPIGRKREITRILLAVTLPPLGRGHTFNRDLIQISGTTPAARAA